MPRLDKLGVDIRTLEVLANLPVPITLGRVVLLAGRIPPFQYTSDLRLNVTACATDSLLLLICFSVRYLGGRLASGWYG